MASGDWIKLHRKLLESAVFSDEWMLKLWIWCLLRAGYCDRNVGGSIVPSGSFITGRFAAADELNVSPSKWYRGIHQLASLGMITLSASKERTIVSVCNWLTYQSDSDVHEQQVNRVWTTSEQQVNTRKEGKEEKKEKPEPEQMTEIAFPVTGDPDQPTWLLPVRVVEVLRNAFPSLDILAESRKAAAWCELNPAKRKTFKGMTRFMHGWMERAQNNNHKPSGQKSLPLSDTHVTVPPIDSPEVQRLYPPSPDWKELG